MSQSAAGCPRLTHSTARSQSPSVSSRILQLADGNEGRSGVWKGESEREEEAETEVEDDAGEEEKGRRGGFCERRSGEKCWYRQGRGDVFIFASESQKIVEKR